MFTTNDLTVIFESLPEPYLVLLPDSPQFTIVAANQAFLQISQLKKEQIIGQSIFDAFPFQKVEQNKYQIKLFSESLLMVLKNRNSHQTDVLQYELPTGSQGTPEILYRTIINTPVINDNNTVTHIISTSKNITRQVLANHEFKEIEKQFLNLITQSPIAMGIFKGRDMEIELANNAMLKIWQKEGEAVKGRKHIDLLPELAGQKYPLLMEKVYDTGIPYQENESPAYINSKNGMVRYFLDYLYAPLFEPDSRKVTGIIVTVNDVTERVEARNSINDAEQRSRLAIEAAEMGTFDWDMVQSEFIYSERLAHIFGYTNNSGLRHNDFTDRIHTGDIALRKSAHEKAIKTGSLHYEARLIWPDTSVHWVKVMGKILYDANKNPYRMHGTAIDITDQKKAVIELEESEERFRMLANFMPQQIWTSDTTGTLNYFNQAVYDYSGLSIEDIDKNGWLQIVHTDDREENINKWMHAVATGEDFFCEHRFRRYDGEYRWKLSRAVAQKDNTGKIQMWVGTSTDIHDQKLMAEDLEKRVEQRTHELKQANEELQRKNAELEQFAYIASHDLQEPLRKIQTFAELLQKNLHNETAARNYFDKITSSAQRMSVLIRDILHYSRLTNMQEQFTEIDLNEIVTTITSDFELLIEEKNAIIRSEKLPVVKGMYSQLSQLFLNIIGNSLKFCEVDPIIDISSEQLSANDIQSLPQLNPSVNYCKISIRDNGIGFEQQYAEQIFSIFQRLNNRQFSGTGIGLALCKRIVENHQGLIRGYGEPGKGALFVIYLPAEG